MNLRSILRQILFTQNTLRYVVEWRCVLRALESIPTPVDTIFDGGAGSGEYLRKVLARGLAKNALALEYDATNFLRLEENLGGRPDAKLMRGSLLEVPLSGLCADVVMSTQVLEHIEDHQTAASELNRVLKPGGYAVITTPHPPEPFPNDDHVREGYTVEELNSLFSPYGWKLLATDFFLTKDTVDAMMAADRLPKRGVFLPVRMIDRERGLTLEQRRAQRPFGVLGLFQKPA